MALRARTRLVTSRVSSAELKETSELVYGVGMSE